MSDTFLGYLRAERERLERGLARARADGFGDEEFASLRRQQRIVDDQLSRWSFDLAEEARAA